MLDLSSSAIAPNSWVCDVCTFANKKPLAPICEICQSERTGSKQEESKQEESKHEESKPNNEQHQHQHQRQHHQRHQRHHVVPLVKTAASTCGLDSNAIPNREKIKANDFDGNHDLNVNDDEEQYWGDRNRFTLSISAYGAPTPTTSCLGKDNVSSSPASISPKTDKTGAKSTPLLLTSSATIEQTTTQTTTNPTSTTKTQPTGNKPSSESRLSGQWNFMKQPTPQDFKGKRKRKLAFDLPPKPFAYIVVLDFEWTCDNRQKVLPYAEIIEFPSVLLKCYPANGMKQAQCEIIDQIQMYVKPRHNPILSPFSIELCAIPQRTIDAAEPLDQVLVKYQHWLQKHGLVVGGEHTFSILTWGDSDVMSTLFTQCIREGIELPMSFRQGWINLKVEYQRHFKRSSSGLRRCVEACGLKFEGRAHSGLVDSINTAKIVIKMIEGGFKFVRFTRGFGKDGQPYGAKKSTPSATAVVQRETETDREIETETERERQRETETETDREIELRDAPPALPPVPWVDYSTCSLKGTELVQEDALPEHKPQIPLSTADLVRRYLTLTKDTMPAIARELQKKWPVRNDHCFQRIVLDAVCDGIWYQHLARPAYKHLNHEQATRAVQLCEDIVAERVDLHQLNKQSLIWRGKK